MKNSNWNCEVYLELELVEFGGKFELEANPNCFLERAGALA